MKIKSIRIKKYKSINTPQTIEFGEDGLVTLIGKNGSGKTNILKAIKAVFDVNANEYYHGIKELNYSVKLELDDETLKELEELAERRPDDRFIDVYNNGDKNRTNSLKANVFSSRLYADALKKSASAIKTEAAELIERFKNFENLVTEIKITDDSYDDGYFYTFEDIRKSQACGREGSIGNYTLKYVIENLDGIIKSICSDEDEIALRGYDGYSYGNRNTIKFTVPTFRLVYREPYMTELDKRCILTIDREKIKHYIEEVNVQIAAYASELKPAVDKFNKKIEQFNDLVYKARRQDDEEYELEKQAEERKEGFMTKIRSAIARTCHYIPASEQLFGKSRGYGDEYYDNYNFDRLLTETYIGLKYDGETRDKILSEFAKERKLDKVLKNLGIDENGFAADFEIELNKNLPAFDRGMITKIEVKNEHGLELFIVEKNGTKTPFANTSLGRRWYFTYYFIKKSLKKGDVLILDEPGAFLHPEAQTEILRDLEKLSESNTVILCTHSPYMISGKFNNLHIVRMNKETAVSHINLNSLDKLRKDTGLSDYNSVTLNNSIVMNSIILNFPNEQILCEGVRDVACIQAFMDYFKVDKKNYSVLQTIGFGHAKPLIEFYLNNGINARVLLDADSKEDILKKKIKVPNTLNENETMAIGEIPKEYLTLVFAGSEAADDRQDIEGLFCGEDREIFLEIVPSKKQTKVRMDIAEILSERGCDKRTESNFRKLFEELMIMPSVKPE